VCVAVLTGCTAQSDIVAGSEVAVAVTDPFTSANPDTSFGRSSDTNADAALLTTTGFGYTDDRGETVSDGSFGTTELLSRDPLTVKYTVNAGVEWSDGVPIDASDLLLAWVANSGAENTPKFDDSSYVDATTGRYTRPFPDDVVFFDGRIGAGLEKSTKVPAIGDDGRSLTVTFDSDVPNWRSVLEPGIPAHVLAHRALHTSLRDATAGKAAVLEAIQKHRGPQLHALARAWNDDYNLDSTPKTKDAGLLVSSGPYSIAKITPTRVVLAANPRYSGNRRPSFETVTLRISPDPLETTKLLATGAVDIATPQPGDEVAKALVAIPGLTVTAGTEARYEHLDLQFSHGKHSTFDDERVRRAFLKVVPRQQILAQLGSGGGGSGGSGASGDGDGAQLLDSFVVRYGAVGYAQTIAKNGSGAYASTDVDAAEKLLAEAGVTSPEVCILYDPSNRRRVSEFQLIQKSAARAGFAVTDCSSPDWQGLLGVDGSYDAALFAWDTTRVARTAQASVFRSGEGLANYNHYDDAASDALIDQLAATDDPAQQTALLTKLDARIWSQAYGLPLYAYPTLTAVDARVAGVTRSPLLGSVFWNAWTWKPVAATDSPSTRP
jgi:peptide/nickel transport system substrate-binding protein